MAAKSLTLTEDPWHRHSPDAITVVEFHSAEYLVVSCSIFGFRN